MFMRPPSFDDLCTYSMDLDHQDHFAAGAQWAIDKAKTVERGEIDILREIEFVVRGYGHRELWPLFDKLNMIRKG